MYGNIIGIAAVMLGLSVFSCCKKESAAILPATEPILADTSTVLENRIDRNALLKLVNGIRSRGCKCGDIQLPAVGQLTWNGLLEKAAYNHSKDMARNNYFNHINLANQTPGFRLDAVGYRWYTYAENIAVGNMDEQGVILGWLSSPKHCVNMMNADFNEIGIGRYNAYWTMELGNRNIIK